MAPKTKLVAFHPVHGYKIKPQQDLKTIKRNERERKRVETVNRGFETLRQHVPTAAQIKKLSKVSILTEAMDYIQYLYGCLQHSPSEPVLLNYSQRTAPSSPLLYQSGPFQYQQHQDQGFYSDYSQHSPAAWTPHFTPKHEPQYTPKHEPQYTPKHEPHYTPNEPQYTPKHEPEYTLRNESHVQYTPRQDRAIPFPLKHEAQSPLSQPQYLQSAAHEDEGESSGEEDDILDAIAEWQQQ